MLPHTLRTRYANVTHRRGSRKAHANFVFQYGDKLGNATVNFTAIIVNNATWLRFMPRPIPNGTAPPSHVRAGNSRIVEDSPSTDHFFLVNSPRNVDMINVNARGAHGEKEAYNTDAVITPTPS